MRLFYSAIRKIYRALLLFSWYIGGQKEHRESGKSVSACSLISDDATLIFSENIFLGENVLIMAGAKLISSGMPPYLEPCGKINIGSGSIIREGAILQSYGGSIVVGKKTAINPYCVIQGNGGVTIGDSTLIAAGVKIFSANHVFSSCSKLIQQQGEESKGVLIGSDVWVGADCTILDGVCIGNGAVVAAGSVVTKNIPEFAVAAGVPASVLKYRNDNKI